MPGGSCDTKVSTVLLANCWSEVRGGLNNQNFRPKSNFARGLISNSNALAKRKKLTLLTKLQSKVIWRANAIHFAGGGGGCSCYHDVRCSSSQMLQDFKESAILGMFQLRRRRVRWWCLVYAVLVYGIYWNLGRSVIFYPPCGQGALYLR